MGYTYYEKFPPAMHIGKCLPRFSQHKAEYELCVAQLTFVMLAHQTFSRILLFSVPGRALKIKNYNYI